MDYSDQLPNEAYVQNLLVLIKWNCYLLINTGWELIKSRMEEGRSSSGLI